MNNSLDNFSTKIISINDFKWLLKAIVKSWYFFILVPMFFFFVGMYYKHKIVPNYASKIEILLKSNDVYDYQENLYSNVGFYNYYGDVTNQIRIITSYDLIEKTLSKLDFSKSYFIAGRLNTKEFFNGMPFKIDIDILNRSLYESPVDFKILDRNSYNISYELNGQKITRTHQFDSTEISIDYSINTQLTKSFNIENSIDINYIVVVHTMNYWVNRILSNITVNNVDYTSILTLKLNDEVPIRSKIFLDSLAQVYIDYTLQNQFKINENTLRYINIQLEEVVSIMDSIEYDLQNVRDENGILDIDKESNEYFRDLMKHESLKRQLQLKNKSLKSLKDYILAVEDDNVIPPSLFILDDDIYLEKSISKFYQSQLEKVDMTYGVKSEHQGLLKINESIANQRKDLLIYIENSEKAFEEKILDEVNEIKYFKNLVRSVPKSARDLEAINRKLEVNERLYTFLLEKRANTYIARSGIIPQTKVIEKARLLGRIDNDSASLTYLFFLIGLIAALILSIIKHLIFYKVENLNELNSLTNFPILGAVPFIEMEKDV